jgi:hypothetical protein
MDKRYTFRIYNKTLDILDKKLYKISDISGYKKYYNLLNKNELLTRLELQLNSKIIKEKKLSLSDILNDDLNNDKLFHNIFVNCFDTDAKKIRDNTKKTDVLTQKSYKFKKDFNKTMLRAYLKNVYFLDP